MIYENLPCFGCGKLVESLHEVEDASITQGAWNDACTIEITGGFGSAKFDMGTYHGVICDECIEKNAARLKQVVRIEQQKKYQYSNELAPHFFEKEEWLDGTKLGDEHTEETKKRLQESFKRGSEALKENAITDQEVLDNIHGLVSEEEFDKLKKRLEEQ